MVHLSSVVPEAVKDSLLSPEPSIANKIFSTSVYGTKWAGQDLPKYEMAEEEIPASTAYKLIKDELSLDGTPQLNLASFVTTYMEDEAAKLMQDALDKNFIDYEEYPQTVELQNRCVNMIARLFNAPTEADADALGVSTVGSSEAIILATLAMKKKWQIARRAVGKSTERPNIVMGANVQVCWEKAARYLDVEERYTYSDNETLILKPEEAVDLVDENTIGICVILGSTYTGEYEDVKRVNDLLIEKKKEFDGYVVPIHVDAASGGFVAPFVKPDLVWDFRLPRVVSINASGHKYGLVYPGIGWAVWRSEEFLPKELIFNINYLGAAQASFTLNFSKGASNVIAQYYQLIRLGKSGYRAIMQQLTQNSDYLYEKLVATGKFRMLSSKNGDGLPVVAFCLKEKHHYNEDDIARGLREHSWIVPSYTAPPKASDLKMLRIVVREDFTHSRAQLLLRDINRVLENLEAKLPAEIASHAEHTRKAAHHREHHHTKAFKHYKNEHNLGRHGKTQQIC